MRRILTATFGAAAVAALVAMPAAAAHGGEPTVIVMQHICNADIQSEADFVAVENEGAGGEPGGEGTLPGLVATVLACPAVVQPGDTPTNGIAATPTSFDYTVADAEGASYVLSADGEFMAAKLCESDVSLDVDGDGDMDDTTCLDVSMYEFAPTAEGEVTITQTAPVGNSRFGTIRFTPGSTDEATEVSASNGVIVLDTTADEAVAENPLGLAEYNDDVATVHVYNFQNAAAAPMPSTAMEQPVNSSLPLALTGFGLLALGGSAAFVAQRRMG